jgi:hypothetical protein
MKPTKLFEATRYLSRGFEQCCIKCNNDLFKREAIKNRTAVSNEEAKELREAKKKLIEEEEAKQEEELQTKKKQRELALKQRNN